jgi:uncharacterized protein DUF4375
VFRFWLLDKRLGLDTARLEEAMTARPLLKTSRQSFDKHPQGVMSAVVTRLTETAYDQLSDRQRLAWLVATYDRAVQNGGHAEYFKVYGVGRAADVRAVFADLDADAQHRIVNAAIALCLSRPGETSFVDFRGYAPPDYAHLDAAYRAVNDETRTLLEAMIRWYLADFILLEE